MNLKILDQKKYPLLHREEYKLKIDFSKTTPSGSEIKEKVVGLVKISEDRVVVKCINQEFGSNSAKVLVYVYDNLMVKDSIEVIKNKKYKKKLEEERKKAFEAKKAEKAVLVEEKKVEDGKEEKTE